MRKLLLIEPWHLIVVFTVLLCLVGFVPLHAIEIAPLELHQSQSSPTDLRIIGHLQGVAAGESRWLRWSDLNALPSRTIETTGEFMSGTHTVRIVPLQALLDRLPLDPTFDTVIAECSDGYTAVYDRPFRQTWQPFIIVAINGQGPAAWPLPGMPQDPGPYIVSVSDAVTPGVSALLDVAHKQPWGTQTLRLVNGEDEFRPLHAGGLVDPPADVVRGRTLWINSCHSCHTGPGDVLGGTRSGRPFVLLQTLATSSPEYVEAYVRNPKNLRPDARMTPHDHYTAAQIADLLAFLRAAPQIAN